MANYVRAFAFLLITVFTAGATAHAVAPNMQMTPIAIAGTVIPDCHQGADESSGLSVCSILCASCFMDVTASSRSDIAEIIRTTMGPAPLNIAGYAGPPNLHPPQTVKLG